MTAMRRPWLGLDLGGGAPVSAHGALGYAVVTSRDLREAAADAGALRHHAQRRDGVDVHRHPRRPDACTPPSAPSSAACAASSSTPCSARSCAWSRPPSARYRRACASSCRCPRRRGASSTSASASPRCVRAARVRVPFRPARPGAALHRRRRQGARERLPRMRGGAGRGGRREHGAARGGPAGQRGRRRLSAHGRVAARCGISARTLIRRLHDDGATFQQLLDAARKQRALWMLLHTAEPVEEIAARLGYVDTSNFSRTVRRWFGATPRELREAPDRR